MPGVPRAVAASLESRGALPLRELPASLRAALGLPGLRRARHDRPDDELRERLLQRVRRQHARRGMTREVAPSILAADFGRLRAQVEEVVAAGARVIHVDIMDGHFVAPLSMGPGAVEALRDLDVILDVHLMIEAPERQVEAFAAAGAHHITVHAEATPHVHGTLQHIRELGCRAGLAFCPSTPPAMLEEVDVDIALCMSVNPGWGGQAFIPSSPDKVRRMRALLGEGPDLEVAGGIHAHPAGPCADAGAPRFVAGSLLFGSEDPARSLPLIASAAGCSQPH